MSISPVSTDWFMVILLFSSSFDKKELCSDCCWKGKQPIHFGKAANSCHCDSWGKDAFLEEMQVFVLLTSFVKLLVVVARETEARSIHALDILDDMLAGVGWSMHGWLLVKAMKHIRLKVTKKNSLTTGKSAGKRSSMLTSSTKLGWTQVNSHGADTLLDYWDMEWKCHESIQFPTVVIKRKRMLRGLKDLHGAILDESFRKGMVTGKICTCIPLNELEYENSDPVKYQSIPNWFLCFNGLFQDCQNRKLTILRVNLYLASKIGRTQLGKLVKIMQTLDFALILLVLSEDVPRVEVDQFMGITEIVNPNFYLASFWSLNFDTIDDGCTSDIKLELT
ncbi:hypothetical protein POTOM_013961 [Populus tomentosa]|uniref:Uncharacterized protein n=1 Tax=Populus tomentosa TaxID=118781 RepID=A0A8X8A162_POPTO|nr:hypothetical protein POTOM_013961 [Populus tomentosa]